jgi:hypothetical protein
VCKDINLQNLQNVQNDTAQSMWTDPFSDTSNYMNNPTNGIYGDSLGEAYGNYPKESGPKEIHPIAIPMNMYSDLQTGAKPVLPGSMAPQFENQPAKNPGIRQEETRTTTTLDSVDPFADLF